MRNGRTISTWALFAGILCFGLLVAAHPPVGAQAPPAKVTPPNWKGPNGPIDLKLKDPALNGAIDLHAHLDPDISGGGQVMRALDLIDYARIAKARGMRGARALRANGITDRQLDLMLKENPERSERNPRMVILIGVCTP